MSDDFAWGVYVGGLVGGLIAWAWNETWHARAHARLWKLYTASLHTLYDLTQANAKPPDPSPPVPAGDDGSGAP